MFRLVIILFSFFVHINVFSQNKEVLGKVLYMDQNKNRTILCDKGVLHDKPFSDDLGRA